MAFHRRYAGPSAVLRGILPDHQRSDSRIVPFPPTTHNRLPSLVPKIELRAFDVPLLCFVQLTPPSSDSRIVPYRPTAHSRWPSSAEKIELSGPELVLCQAQVATPSSESRIAPAPSAIHSRLPSLVPKIDENGPSVPL